MRIRLKVRENKRKELILLDTIMSSLPLKLILVEAIRRVNYREVPRRAKICETYEEKAYIRKSKIHKEKPTIGRVSH